ncbi:MAG: glycosyltransferase [Caulobacteraceae bacterium]|nr:glycosyltransferase [Caulobacteraceae bacterium]
MEPLERVDVIVPVYNQPDVVAGCIESVLATIDRRVAEVIVIDDGSTNAKVVSYLRSKAESGAITLHINDKNRGFTRTVNRGMRCHPDRDVLLLNSDTVVYGCWLERLRAAAYSGPKIATVNPLTNASHISAYPHRDGNSGVALELDDKTLDAMAAARNKGVYVDVHTTVGFCMYIRRDCLRTFGLFDERHFPVGYGEESDFCYRARKVGWRHLVAGDVFVRHLDGQSFGERKNRLVKEMLAKFHKLHPDVALYDAYFEKADPVRTVRSRLDLARVRRALGGAKELRLVAEARADAAVAPDRIFLDYDVRGGVAQLVVAGSRDFPNLRAYRMPGDMSRFNADMRYLGVERIRCSSAQTRSFVDERLVSTPAESRLGPALLGPEGGWLEADTSAAR